ncbi:cyclophilin-like domain-containing protein [Catenaria anguillulae PL171]|uniref:Cyclophilin-like domain-containing protein n=1 Tax=Catenaria anguillulae PL171 TaxID=765915 RepID=A0A1Y2HZH8_9FUNG|nr:cyclophilin-like domain-containing protein [Catenaria anguillulae PL171]
MGKWTDKLYITHSEWSNQHSAGGLAFGGAPSSGQPKASPSRTRSPPAKAMSLTGTTLRNGSRPAPPRQSRHGPALGHGRLDSLHFHTSADDPASAAEAGVGDGVFQCPITRKAFTDATHIVAVATSGNVFSNEALVEVLKGGKLRDPLDDTPFTKRDIITIQDPTDLERNNLEDIDKEGEAGNLKSTSGLAKRVLDEVKTTEFSKIDPKPSSSSSSTLAPTTSSTSNPHGKSTGRTAASFTSTSMPVHTSTETEAVDALDAMYEDFCAAMMAAKKELGQAKGKGAVKEAKKKVDKGFGYVRIKTNLGDLNIELWCVSAPRTCHNFLLLAERGYYRGVAFHRLIPGFMIQGGDPTGTGKGGTSAWGPTPFQDEIKPSLRHDSRGLLSMANRGPGTNTSQFFITLAPAPHLDGKHTLFGRVVGGMDVLDRIESIATDPKTDRPVQEIVMVDVQVFVNPFDVWEKERERIKVDEERKRLTQSERVKREGTWLGSGAAGAGAASGASLGVGKYLKQGGAAPTSVVPGGFAMSQAAAAVGESDESSVKPAGQKRTKRDKP